MGWDEVVWEMVVSVGVMVGVIIGGYGVLVEMGRRAGRKGRGLLAL